ncbi:MAG TPA: hypothetical protein VGG28_02855 [Kofleriaceae bacterium]|jgi:hypothetical protein
MTKRDLHSIDLQALSTVTGGADAAPISIGSINMGPPKYSAAWWDFVRSRPGVPK